MKHPVDRMKSKQIPLLSFTIGVPDNPCDCFSSTRTISRRRPRLRETLPPALLSSRPPSKQGWMAWNLLDFGWRERERERVQSTVAKGPSISIYCRTSSSSSLCAADHKRVIYAAADRTTAATARQKRYRINNVVRCCVYLP